MHGPEAAKSMRSLLGFDGVILGSEWLNEFMESLLCVNNKE